MIKILLILLAVIIIFGVGAFAFTKYKLSNPTDNKNLQTSIDKEVKKYLDKDLSYGIVVGVYKEGQVFIKTYGSTQRGGNETPNKDSIYEIASISKLFTTSLLQILADENVVNLEDSLGELIGGKIDMSPQISKITLLQLATHTSGLPRLPKIFFDKAPDMKNPYAVLTKQDLLAFIAQPEDLRKSGRFEYSNLGMGLLGHVLEWVTGEELDALFATKIYTPLGMENSAIVMTKEMLQNLVQGYAESGDENPVWDFPILPGAGAIRSSANDMMKFVRANLVADNKLSSSLQKTHIASPGAKAGLGWIQPGFIEWFFGNSNALWHNGQVGGYASYISIDKTNQNGVIILSNKSVDVTLLGIMVTLAVRTQSWAN